MPCSLRITARRKPGLQLQGPSPDEVALVEGGRQLGFEFLSRTMQGVTLRMLGHEATFDVLNMMEFSSERGRMSVIARSPDGTIRLYAKGADSKMLATLNKNTNQELLDQTARNLHLFATQVSISCLDSDRQCSGLLWPSLMACRSVVAIMCLSPLQSTLGAVHSLGWMVCTACLKVTTTCLVLLPTLSALGLAFPILGSSHHMRLSKAALPYMARSTAIAQHTTARRTFTRARCHNWSMQLCWDFSAQVISHC